METKLLHSIETAKLALRENHSGMETLIYLSFDSPPSSCVRTIVVWKPVPCLKAFSVNSCCVRTIVVWKHYILVCVATDKKVA